MKQKIGFSNVGFISGYRVWTDAEKDYLRKNGHLGVELIAHHLRRSVQSVKVMACRMGVSLANTSRVRQGRWTDAERRYLSQHRTDGAERIAVALGRTPASVTIEASKLHVSLRVKPGDVCPVCGTHSIRQGTSDVRHGMCRTCWEREKARVLREANAERRARLSYDAAKDESKRISREEARRG